jgi:hypothetical protein
MHILFDKERSIAARHRGGKQLCFRGSSVGLSGVMFLICFGLLLFVDRVDAEVRVAPEETQSEHSAVNRDSLAWPMPLMPKKKRSGTGHH